MSLFLSQHVHLRECESARPRFIAAYKFFSLLTVQMCPEQSSRHTRTHDKVSFCCRRRCVSRARTTAKAAQAGGRRIKNEMAISGRLSRPASLLFKSIFTAAGRKTRSLSLSVNPRLCPHAGEAAALTWPLSSCKNILPPSAGRGSFARSLFSRICRFC